MHSFIVCLEVGLENHHYWFSIYSAVCRHPNDMAMDGKIVLHHLVLQILGECGVQHTKLLLTGNMIVDSFTVVSRHTLLGFFTWPAFKFWIMWWIGKLDMPSVCSKTICPQVKLIQVYGHVHCCALYCGICKFYTWRSVKFEMNTEVCSSHALQAPDWAWIFSSIRMLFVGATW